MTFVIDLATSTHDDGYNPADWFAGGAATVARAEDADTREDVDRILRDAYLGPDVDGVSVTWEILDHAPRL